MKKYITEKNLNAYREHLYEEEKSPATIRKYMCDLRKLSAYLGTQELTKKKMIAYKEMLRSSSQYQLSSINSFLTASNCFFDYMGWDGMNVRLRLSGCRKRCSSRNIKTSQKQNTKNWYKPPAKAAGSACPSY